MDRENGGRLLVVADDYGLTRATSAAIIEAHRAGVVTATSVLGNGRATVSTIRMLDDVPELEVGAHIAIVGEDPPLLSAREIPTLVGRSGRFVPSWRQLLPLLAARRVDPADVRRELDAQIEALVGHRLPLTHLNFHQNLQLWPTVGEVAARAAREHGIGYVRTPSSARALRGRAIRHLATRLRRTLVDEGLDTSDAFLGLDEAGRWTEVSLVSAIGEMVDPVVELNVHPGAPVDPDRWRYRWGYGWDEECRALVAASTRGAVTNAGYRLVGPSACRSPTAPGSVRADPLAP